MRRRAWLGLAALLAGGALGGRMLSGTGPVRRSPGYGPLRRRADLWLPDGFEYRVLSRQGDPMSDGHPMPGMFDGMGAFPGPDGTTVLIRNHENRGRPGELPVVVPAGLRYDAASWAVAGSTRLVVRRDRGSGMPEVVESHALMGGTLATCSGGAVPGQRWIACEERVRTSAPTGTKHGYCFAVDALARGPVAARPLPALGRFCHEGLAWHDGIAYMTEDRPLVPDDRTAGRVLGGCFYRFVPAPGSGPALDPGVRGTLQALALRREFHAVMKQGRPVGVRFDVAWVTIPEPDHDDASDDRRDRVPGFTPVRVQAQDRGAACFDRPEGVAVAGGMVHFAATSGGGRGLGQIWQYDPAASTLALLFESTSARTLQHPDNLAVVPATGDLLLQEDVRGDHFVRGLTPEGAIYDFCRSAANPTEFCGGCFDPDGSTLYLNQFGDRPGHGTAPAVTYAITGPFGRRPGAGSRSG